MQIGPIQLENNLILAPMAGISDRPFRGLCRRLGAGLAVSEMISSNASLRNTTKTLRRLNLDGEKRPISIQILGADPKIMAEAARINEAHGADIIDINMGCPVKKVCKTGAGAALLKDERQIAQLLQAVVDSVGLPVTLKIRTGWDQHSRNAVSVAKIAQDAGIQAIAIHGRTRACGFSGQAEYETIRQVKQAVTIPVIANGDIDTPEKAKKVLAITGADGIMIGRAARGRPWIFREIQAHLSGQSSTPEPSPPWLRELVLEHLQGIIDFYGGEDQGIKIARRQLSCYSKNRPGGASFRKRLHQSISAKQQIELVDEFFSQSERPNGMAL